MKLKKNLIGVAVATIAVLSSVGTGMSSVASPTFDVKVKALDNSHILSA